LTALALNIVGGVGANLTALPVGRLIDRGSGFDR
jgi:hypothetical protein